MADKLKKQNIPPKATLREWIGLAVLTLGALLYVMDLTMLALLILGPIVLPEYKDPKAGRLDLISVFMSLVAVLSVIFGLKQIAQDGIGTSQVLTIILGLSVGTLWVRRQLALKDPMIDVRLFKIRAFSSALSVNFLAIFVAIGYFLFVAQYLQLVLGLTPFQAGLWSLPAAFGFIIGSNMGPRLAAKFRPPYIIASGLTLSAVGLVLLTQVANFNGLFIVVLASLVISLGLAPVFGLATELIVGSAPPENAGAASAISETAAELGGALGIAILGSVGIALYRSELAASLPQSIPADAITIARDTLGVAIGAANNLPGELGPILIEVARRAFVQGMIAAAVIGAFVAVASAILTFRLLRNIKVHSTPPH